MTSLLSRNRTIRRAGSFFAAGRERLAGFLFLPVSDHWLTVLRVGLGIQIILCSFSSRKDWSGLFMKNGGGIISRDLMEAVVSLEVPLVPKLGWLVVAGNYMGLSEETILLASWAGLLGAGCLLAMGLFCRTAAISAWFLYLCQTKSWDWASYGMDSFVTIGLFYLMLSPLPDRSALDHRLRKIPLKNPDLHGFFRRVLQLHLCVIYFSGGIMKSLGKGWWTGESIWRALTRPPFNIVPPEWILSWKAILPLAGIAVCVLETGYVVFIWPKKTRPIWLIGIVGMHIGIGLTMGLYLFSLVMIILNLAAFGPDLIRLPFRMPRLRTREAK
jgi:hypothetical protein